MGRARRLGAYGSSHLKHYKSTRQNRLNSRSKFNKKFKHFSRVKSYGGLSVMPDKFDRYTLEKIPIDSEFYKEKVRQFEEFVTELERGGDVEALWVALSNDYKAFITNHLGRVLGLNRGAVKKWKAMSKGDKLVYDVLEEKPWTKLLRVQVQTRFEEYRDIMKSVLARSSLEVLHHSSILERLNPNIENLDLYFAILNSVLEHSLIKWSRNEVFTNRHGKPIRCEFVNVKESFCMASDPKRLFLSHEVRLGGELTHRNDVAMDKVADVWGSVVASG